MSNKPDPFFSIVIPTLNEEKYLPKLLKSLSAQLDKDFEVVVIDGNSEDQTISAARKFISRLPSLTTIASPKRNVSHQRNLGVKNAIGNFLVFLDADVTLPSNFISEVHHALTDEYKNCRFLTTWIRPDSDKKADSVLCNFYNIALEISKTTAKPVIGGFVMVVKKSAFQKVGGFNEKLRMAEDHELARQLHRLQYRLQILRDPKTTISFRRFRREGTLALLRKYAIAGRKYFLEGPITQELFDYPMGGKVKTPHPQKSIKRLQYRFRKYLKNLDSLLSN